MYVVIVLPNTGAAKSGIRKGDFITEVNGVTVNTEPELQGQIARYKPGDKVSIVYNRGGKSFTTTVQLTNLNGTTDIIKPESASKMLGAGFRPLTDKERATYNLGGVMVTDIGKGALAKQTQMKKGFVITAINNTAVNSITDLQQAMEQSKSLQIAGFYPGNQGMYYYGLNIVDESGAEE